MPVPLGLLLGLGVASEGIGRFREQALEAQQQETFDSALQQFTATLPEDRRDRFAASQNFIQAGGDASSVQQLLARLAPPTEQQRIGNRQQARGLDLQAQGQQIRKQQMKQAASQFDRNLQVRLAQLGQANNANSLELAKSQLDTFKKVNDIANAIGDDARPLVNQFNELNTQFENMRSSLASGRGADSVASVIGFMKLLDPGSVVREGEAEFLTKQSGLPTRIIAAINQAVGTGGSLADPKIRNELADSVNNLYRNRLNTFTRDIESVRRRVQGAQRSIPANTPVNASIEELSGLSGQLTPPELNPININQGNNDDDVIDFNDLPAGGP